MFDLPEPTVQAMLEWCQSVKASGTVPYPCMGICRNMIHHGLVVPVWQVLPVQNSLEQMFKTWPEFSGNIAYPVPHPDQHKYVGEAIIDAAVRAFNNYDLWVGEYGAARFRLLDHIIDTLTKELNNAV